MEMTPEDDEKKGVLEVSSIPGPKSQMEENTEYIDVSSTEITSVMNNEMHISVDGSKVSVSNHPTSKPAGKRNVGKHNNNSNNYSSKYTEIRPVTMTPDANDLIIPKNTIDMYDNEMQLTKIQDNEEKGDEHKLDIFAIPKKKKGKSLHKTVGGRYRAISSVHYLHCLSSSPSTQALRPDQISIKRKFTIFPRIEVKLGHSTALLNELLNLSDTKNSHNRKTRTRKKKKQSKKTNRVTKSTSYGSGTKRTMKISDYPDFPRRLMYQDSAELYPQLSLDLTDWGCGDDVLYLVSRAGKRRIKKGGVILPQLSDLEGHNTILTSLVINGSGACRNSNKTTNVGISHLNACQALQKITLSNLPYITEKAFFHIRATHAFLTEVILDNCQSVGDKAIIHLMTGCRRLNKLELRNLGGITDEGLAAIAIRPPPPDIEVVSGGDDVNMKHSKPTDDYFKKPVFHAITELVIANCPSVSDKGISDMFAGSSLKHLKVLKLIKLTKLTDLCLMGLIRGESACQTIVALKALTISCVPITSSGLAWIATGCPQLTYLDICGSDRVDDIGISKLGEHCLQLQTLNLNGLKLISDDGIRNMLRNVHCLTSLDISDMPRITDEGILAVSRYCPDLKKISIVGINKLTDLSMCALGGGCTALTDLNISGRGPQVAQNVGIRALYGSPRLTDNAIIALAIGARSLKTLDLSGLASLTNSTLSAIARYCKDISILILAGCTEITDTGIIEIIESCSALRTLNLSYCGKITDVTLAAIGRGCRSETYENGKMEVSFEPILLENLILNCCGKITDIGMIRLVGDNSPSVPTSNLTRLVPQISHPLQNEEVSRGCRTLTMISFKTCPLLTDFTLLVIGRSLIELKTLDISFCDFMTLQGLHSLFPSGNGVCKYLNSIKFWGCFHITAKKYSARLDTAAEEWVAMGRLHKDRKKICPLPNQASLEKQISFEKLVQNELAAAKIIQNEYVKYRRRKETTMHAIAVATQNSKAEAKARRKRARWQRKAAAASIKIQKVYRGFVDRKTVKALSKKLNEAAPYIQKIVRGYFGRIKAKIRFAEVQEQKRLERLRRKKASIIIQSIWRSFTARTNTGILFSISKFENYVQLCGANTIQNAWRCHQARQKKSNQLRLFLEKIMREKRSATIIANTWRGYKAKGIMKIMRNRYRRKRKRRALKIQTWGRRMIAKRYVQKRRMKYNAAAPPIQRSYRCYKAREILRILSAAKIARDKLVLASTYMIQNAWRCYKAKSVANVIRWKIWMEKQRLNAAIRTQASFRRYRCRRKILARKIVLQHENIFRDRNALRESRINSLRINGAAILIQHWFKCYLERRYTLQKITWLKEEAILTIQKYARGFIYRTAYKIKLAKWLRAITKLQNWRRAKRAQRMLQDLINIAIRKYIDEQMELQDTLTEFLLLQKKKLSKNDFENDMAERIQRMVRSWMARTINDRADREYILQEEARRKVPIVLSIWNSTKATYSKRKKALERKKLLEEMTEADREKFLLREKEKKEEKIREDIARKARILARARDKEAKRILRIAERTHREAIKEAKVKFDLAEQYEYICEQSVEATQKICDAAPGKFQLASSKLDECKKLLKKAKGLEKRPLNEQKLELEEAYKLAKEAIKSTRLAAKKARLNLIKAKKDVVIMELELEVVVRDTEERMEIIKKTASDVRTGALSAKKAAKKKIIRSPSSSPIANQKKISKSQVNERLKQRKKQKDDTEQQEEVCEESNRQSMESHRMSSVDEKEGKTTSVSSNSWTLGR